MKTYHSFRRALWRSALAVCLFAQLTNSISELFAQGAPAPLPMPTRQEKIGYLQAEFELLDANRDGRISNSEFEKNSKQAIQKAERIANENHYAPNMVSYLYTMNLGSRKKFPDFSQVDTNGDDQITFHQEYLKFSSLIFSDFSKWDLNDDGHITTAEFLAAKHDEFKERQAEAEVQIVEAPKKQLKLEFNLRDRNKDGIVTWKEILIFEDMLPPVLYEGTFADKSFIQVDANFDGAISRDEFLAHARKSNDSQFLLLKEKVFLIRDLNGDQNLSFAEFIETGENPARAFVAYDQDGDGVILFEDVKGISWVAGKDINRDRCYFDRLDLNQDKRVTWQEFRKSDARGIAFGAIDHLDIDNSISRDEWNAVEQEYRDEQNGKIRAPHAASGYAISWFPWIFDMVTFDMLDPNRDDGISWEEFRAYPDEKSAGK